MHVFLDLDETLISSIEQNVFDTKVPQRAKAQLLKRPHHFIEGYIVFERPGVQDFLDRVFKLCKVNVWTAASSGYAADVIDRVVLARPNRHLRHVFVDVHCASISPAKNIAVLHKKTGGYLRLGDLNDTIIIDDNPRVARANVGRCIHVPAYRALMDTENNDNVCRTLSEHISRMHMNPSRSLNSHGCSLARSACRRLCDDDTSQRSQKPMSQAVSRQVVLPRSVRRVV